jgi:hypothetical protein
MQNSPHDNVLITNQSQAQNETFASISATRTASYPGGNTMESGVSLNNTIPNSYIASRYPIDQIS